MFKYFIVGIVQGLTEFLPISSSGHIVLFGSFFNLDNLLLISIVAHIGTLFAVLFCYRERLISLIRHPLSKTNLYLIIATIPTVIVVLLFHRFIEKQFGTGALVWGFLLSAVLLVMADLKKDGSKSVSKSSALVMGLGQSVAILPGISRSGSTLVSGLLLGVDKKQALDFSFLMSIPIILASTVWESVQLFTSQISVNWSGIIVVMISSFVFGILSIKIMLKLMEKNKLFVFAIYLIVLSLVVLLVV